MKVSSGQGSCFNLISSTSQKVNHRVNYARVESELGDLGVLVKQAVGQKNNFPNHGI
jgi:hypothetical protein